MSSRVSAPEHVGGAAVVATSRRQDPSRGPASSDGLSLDLIDAKADDGVLWCILDEGCNACCHSEAWSAKAEAIFRENEFGYPFVNRKNKTYTGLGGVVVQSTGKRRLPFCLGFDSTSNPADRRCLTGTMESWEIPGDGPFLMSNAAQAKLGFVKDMASGNITCKMHGQNSSLRMRKDRNTGLLAINLLDLHGMRECGARSL